MPGIPETHENEKRNQGYKKKKSNEYSSAEQYTVENESFTGREKQ